ncbi:FadR/GntR family transcriptional regulator [Risungbinella massiliensis]|uniref:FadR/GntR family transcriptional regulator n=1 Tax=Risungbinella massiliensis TaxID=1329796 RepID=UPI0005CC0168|nr:FadR/GntR family transcriptional regulator [Risungbinella massiliensis]
MHQERNTGKFQSILKGIHSLIEEDRLRPGDRLPSERELSERLGAGRSSVREVLRALELLGLIVTRRGEGTFLQPYHTHHLVQLLADYILRDRESQEDLVDMRILLELEAVRLAVGRASDSDIEKLKEILQHMEEWIQAGYLPHQQKEEFHHTIVRLSKNKLLIRTWFPVHQYFTLCTHSNQDINKWQKVVKELKQVLRAIQDKDSLCAYQRLQQHLEQFLSNSLNEV